MTTPQELREWLKTMQYPNWNAKEEVLEKLCTGDMSYIFQQIIDKVKPRQAVEINKRHAIVNYVLCKGTNENIPSKYKPEQVKLYEEKVKLEKELREINSKNDKSELNLNHLISKVTTKNMKVQDLRKQIKNDEKECALFRGKSAELDKQLNISQKLYNNAKTLIRKKGETPEEISRKTTETIAKLSQIIDQNETQIGGNSFEKKSTSCFSFSGPRFAKLQTTVGKKSIKNFLSSTPQHPYRMSDVSNMSVVSTISNISYVSENDTLSSPIVLFDNEQKSFGILQETQANCWNNAALKMAIEDLWNCGCDVVVGTLTHIKKRNRQNLFDAILKRDSKSIENSSKKQLIGIDQLHTIHIENQLSYWKLNLENERLNTLMEKNSGNRSYMPVLKMVERGAEASNNFLREKIKQLREETLSKSDEAIGKTISEIQTTETEMRELRIKINTNLILLKNCNAWFDKIKSEIQREFIQSSCDITNAELGNPLAADMISSQCIYDFLKTNFVSRELDNFIHCPYHVLTKDSCYSWGENPDPEFMELIQKSYLSPHGAIMSLLEEKEWLNKLKALEQESCKKKYYIVQLQDINCARQLTNMQINLSLRNVQPLKLSYRNTTSRLTDFETEMNLFFEAPLNNYIAPSTFHDSKSLKEYVAKYDELYNKLE